ncbi:ribonuclease VapC37 [Mycobacterium lepromatosis]|nr:ribonuclease VapC37 [Mycobacterium lepromatosis]
MLRCADRIGFGWIPLSAFVRLTTKVGLFLRTIFSEDAIGQVADWLTALSAVLAQLGTGCHFVNDAYLAVLAVEHCSNSVSHGSDFGRFGSVPGD